MNPNVGSADRVIRIIVGLGLVSLFFILEGAARWLGVIGVVLIATAVINFCPLYKVLGLSTTGSKAGH
ncbi:MAG: hypothetical protein AMJ66_11295 [Betaproteobacteria bacterium SG8_40]|jgi:hypothetical protein|nr:MAG: hypothetical protein AMJ66_11295 [Betaproteobacteria bacterium SG8_40]